MADSLQEMETPAVFRKTPRGRNLQVVSERTVPDQAQTLADLTKREAAVAAKEKELQMIMAFIRTTLGAVGQRILTLLALLSTAGMFFWAVFEPTAWRLAAAIAFAVVVFLPSAYYDFRSRVAG